MFIEALIATPGTGVFIGGFMNGELLNLPDVIKIGLMAVLAIVLIKWALETMGQTSLASYI